MVGLGLVCLHFSKKLPFKFSAFILTVKLKRVMARPTNCSSALLVALEWSIAIDTVLRFSTPFKKKPPKKKIIPKHNKPAAVTLTRRAKLPTLTRLHWATKEEGNRNEGLCSSAM